MLTPLAPPHHVAEHFKGAKWTTMWVPLWVLTFPTAETMLNHSRGRAEGGDGQALVKIKPYMGMSRPQHQWISCPPLVFFPCPILHWIPGQSLDQPWWLAHRELPASFLPLAGTAGGTSAFSFRLLPFLGCSGAKLVMLVTVSPEL